MPYESRSPSAPRGRPARRRELVGTAVGLLTVAAVVATDLTVGGRLVPLTAVLLGPLLASAFAGRSRVALVAGVAGGCASLLVWWEGLGGLEAWSRLGLVGASGAAAVLTTHLRVRRESALAGAARVAHLSTALQQGLLPHLSGTPRVDVLTRYRPRTEERSSAATSSTSFRSTPPRAGAVRERSPSAWAT